MPKVLANGINIHYQRVGKGPDLVMIHGLTGNLAVWHLKLVGMLQKEFRITTYDLRGHGYTDVPRDGYTTSSVPCYLDGLLDALEIENPYVVGHSFGGSIALHLALLHPDRVAGVVLVDTGVACLRHLRTIKDWPGWKIYEKELNQYGMTYDWFVHAESEDVSDVIRKTFEIPQQFGARKGSSRASPRLKRLVDETALGSEFRRVAGLTEERLAEITTPVLAVYGEMSPYQKMAAHMAGVLPNFRCDLVANTGHFYLLQSPELFAERIRGFLADPAGNVADGRGADGPSSPVSPGTREGIRN